MADHRKRWFTQIIQSALSEDLVAPRMILGHVTPEVMANHLPPALMSEILAKSLSAGAMRPELVLRTLNPELLAEHIPPEVLWGCIAEAGAEAGMNEADGGAVGPLRRFLEAAIASGLDYGMISEEDVLVELTPEHLAQHLPVGLKAELLRACFEADSVDPELVVRTLGVANLAEQMPIPELWRVVSAAGIRAAGGDDGDGARASSNFAIPEVSPVREPPREPPREEPSAPPGHDDITRNAVPADNLQVDLEAPIAIDPPATTEEPARRKPNRRITGAGATTRRRSSRPAGKAAHRAGTDSGDAEIEVVDETDVLLTPPDSKTK
jgi:hypothetical protein